MAGLYAGDGWYGSEVGDLGTVPEALDSEPARIDELVQLEEPPTDDTAPLGVISGVLTGATEDTLVLVVVDNEVVGTSPVSLGGPLLDTFAVVLPQRLVGQPLDVRVLRQEGDAEPVELDVQPN